MRMSFIRGGKGLKACGEEQGIDPPAGGNGVWRMRLKQEVEFTQQQQQQKAAVRHEQPQAASEGGMVKENMR